MQSEVKFMWEATDEDHDPHQEGVIEVHLSQSPTDGRQTGGDQKVLKTDSGEELIAKNTKAQVCFKQVDDDHEVYMGF